jgi:hypothetical protein
MRTMHLPLRRWPAAPVIALAAALCAGCETPAWVRSLNEAFAARRPDASFEAQETHRHDYLATHSRQSMRWLLGHCVDAGMSYKEVCRALGEEGARETQDTWIKTRGGPYQVGDDVYAFGPDNEGQSVYLVFREDQLIGFDPEEFRKGGMSNDEIRMTNE